MLSVYGHCYQASLLPGKRARARPANDVAIICYGCLWTSEIITTGAIIDNFCCSIFARRASPLLLKAALFHQLLVLSGWALVRDCRSRELLRPDVGRSLGCDGGAGWLREVMVVPLRAV